MVPDHHMMQALLQINAKLDKLTDIDAILEEPACESNAKLKMQIKEKTKLKTINIENFPEKIQNGKKLLENILGC